MFYTAIEDGVVGCKCTRCKKFIPEAEFTPHVCPCYEGTYSCDFVIPTSPDITGRHKPSNEPPPKFDRKRRIKNWHLDPKYQAQWGKFGEQQPPP
jgi:hypothetical protein